LFTLPASQTQQGKRDCLTVAAVTLHFRDGGIERLTLVTKRHQTSCQNFAMPNRARKILTLIIAALLVFLAWKYGQYGGVSENRPANPPALQEESCPGAELTDRQTAERLGEGAAHAPVYGHGEVVKILPDDNQGTRHQRFLLRVAPQLVVLVAHNTDIAPRLDSLATGDRLSFCGEYIWNNKGGVLHWTHHDPAGRRPGGWLRSQGKLYR